MKLSSSRVVVAVLTLVVGSLYLLWPASSAGGRAESPLGFRDGDLVGAPEVGGLPKRLGVDRIVVPAETGIPDEGDVLALISLGAIGGDIALPGIQDKLRTYGPLSAEEKARLADLLGPAARGSSVEPQDGVGLGPWIKTSVRDSVSQDMYWTVVSPDPMSLMARLNQHLAPLGLLVALSINEEFECAGQRVSVLVPLAMINMPAHMRALLARRLR